MSVPYSRNQDSSGCISDKIALASGASQSGANQYDDYYKSFTALDGKAQATASTSSLVLAAIAAFLKDGRIPHLYNGTWWTIAVLISPISALISVIVSLCGARVIDIVVPYDADAQIKEARDLSALPCDEFSQEHVLNYHRARLSHWSDALASIKVAVERKAKWVWCGQAAMILALVFLLIVYVTNLLKS